jgi:hypothetical protein
MGDELSPSGIAEIKAKEVEKYMSGQTIENEKIVAEQKKQEDKTKTETDKKIAESDLFVNPVIRTKDNSTYFQIYDRSTGLPIDRVQYNSAEEAKNVLSQIITEDKITPESPIEITNSQENGQLTGQSAEVSPSEDINMSENIVEANQPIIQTMMQWNQKCLEQSMDVNLEKMKLLMNSKDYRKPPMKRLRN